MGKMVGNSFMLVGVAYVYDVCVAISRLINTLLGGDMNETLCSRSGRYLNKHVPRDNYLLWTSYYLVHVVTHFIERDHVFKAMNLQDHRNNFLEKWDFAKRQRKTIVK